MIKLQQDRLLPSSHIFHIYEVEKRRWRKCSTIYYSIGAESFPRNEHTLGCDIWDPLLHITAI